LHDTTVPHPPTPPSHTDEHVVADVVQVSTVLQPRPSHGDVVSGALALGLDEDGSIMDVITWGGGGAGWQGEGGNRDTIGCREGDKGVCEKSHKVMFRQ
jgi:hypothetical protein